MNPNLSTEQFKGLARNALASARTHREGGDLNQADEALRNAQVYREAAQYGTRANGSVARPDFNNKTTHRYGDTPSGRVLP